MRHEGLVSKALFHSDGQIVLTVSGKTVQRWNAKTQRTIGLPLRHDEPVSTAALSPDGRTILTTSDKIARLWDSTTGHPAGAPFNHGAVISSAAFSPDGRRVMTGGGDAAWRLWEVPPAIEKIAMLDPLSRLRTGLDSQEAETAHRLTLAEIQVASQELNAAGSGWLNEQRQRRQQRTLVWHWMQAGESEKVFDWSGAEFHLSALLKLDPNSAELPGRYGHVAAARREWATAILHLKKTAELKPAEPYAWY
jgi:hypothetical protein